MAVIREREVIVDPRLPNPPAVTGVTQDLSEGDSYLLTEDVQELAATAAFSETSAPPVPVIPTIKSMSVYSQTVRIATDGRTVVDVEVEFPNGSYAGVDIEVTTL